MNKFAKMILEKRMMDGRNPYGSAGGYVVSRNDYAGQGGNYGRRDDFAGQGYGNMQGQRNDYGYNGMQGNDYGYGNSMQRNDYAGQGGYGQRNDYGWNNGMPNSALSGNMPYLDGANYNDYGKPKLFSEKDIEKWKKMMHNEDGTRGEHFRPEQVKHASQQAGIDIEEFGDDIFALAMNMMYSVYCKVAKKFGVDRPEYYADMAKAFLRDKDFEGKPEQKLYLYYKAIVEKDD